MAQAEFDDVITALHGGVFEEPYWSSFLDRLRQATQADYVSLVLRRSDAGFKDVCLLNSGSNSASIDLETMTSPNMDLASLEDLLARANLPYRNVAPGKPYTLAEMIRPEHPLHAEYVAYLRERSIDYALGIRVAEIEGGNGWITVGRSGRDFPPFVGDLLTRLFPHLCIAVRTLATLERERMRADIAAVAMQRLNFGWLTFDARGRVIDMDTGAERLFRNTPRLNGVARGQTFPLSGPGKTALLENIAAFADNPDLRPRALHLIDDPWLDMLTAPVGFRAISHGVTPVAVGYVHGVGAASADRCKHLMSLFSLTQSEARLALAMTQGKSIAEAAEELNLTSETARNYSKKIYAKTDTRGQVDLVRLMLASVISLT